MPTRKAMLRRDTVRITIPLQMKQYGGASHIVLGAMKYGKDNKQYFKQHEGAKKRKPARAV